MIEDDKYIIRKATLDDVDFVVTVIVEAEKSTKCIKNNQYKKRLLLKSRFLLRILF